MAADQSNNQNNEIDLSSLPEDVRNLEVIWVGKYPDRDSFVLLDHNRKLVISYYPEGGAPDLEILIESYKQLHSASLQHNYHIASYHPADAKIPISKKTSALNRNVFDPMLSLYLAELIIGPMFIITTSASVKRALLSVEEFIIVIDTDNAVEGLNIAREILDFGDIRNKGQEARQLMSDIHDRTGVNVNFAHEAL